MKKILLLSIVASFALSCSKDALETFPGDKVPSDVVYGSVENARSALTGALAGLGQGGQMQHDADPEPRAHIGGTSGEVS